MNIMQDIAKLAGKPVAALCSSKKKIDELVAAAAEMSGKPGKQDFLLLMSKHIDAARLLPAYLNALVRKKDSMTRASSTSIEMLLFVCGSANISKAIADCGAKSNSGFVVFATSRRLFDRFAKKNGLRILKEIAMPLDFGKAAEVAMLDA